MNSQIINKTRFLKLVSNYIQELILLPTEQCNFRCTYCYENHCSNEMAQDTILGVKNLLNFRAPQLKHLCISWFGGEPLISKNIVLDISSHASYLSKKYCFKYHGSMTTNGYNLTPSTLSALASVGINRYQISLDGPREIHNLTRVRTDGKGTFDRIWTNLLAIRDSNEQVSVTLRIHIDACKIQQIHSLIKDIKYEFMDDSRFKVFFKPIERLGGPNDYNINIMSPQEKKSAFMLLNHELYEHNFVDSIDKVTPCYASRPNSLVIFPDGKIGKCTVALNDRRNHIGKLNSDGTLKINQNLLIPWIRGFATSDIDTLTCPLRKLSSDKRKSNSNII